MNKKQEKELASLSTSELQSLLKSAQKKQTKLKAYQSQKRTFEKKLKNIEAKILKISEAK